MGLPEDEEREAASISFAEETSAMSGSRSGGRSRSGARGCGGGGADDGDAARRASAVNVKARRGEVWREREREGGDSA